MPQRLELLEKVRRIEGCEHYTIKTLTAYFYNLRTRGHRDPRSGISLKEEGQDNDFQSNKGGYMRYIRDRSGNLARA